MTDHSIVPEATEVMRLVERIKPFFAGQQPEVVGAVLADLLSLYLAGHVADNPVKTKALRDQTLRIHLKAVKALLPLNEDMLKERMKVGADAKDRPN